MNQSSPCRGCTDRHAACHGSCEKYKVWIDWYHAQQKHYDANKNRWQSPWSTARERTTRKNLKFSSHVRKQGGTQ